MVVVVYAVKSFQIKFERFIWCPVRTERDSLLLRDESVSAYMYRAQELISLHKPVAIFSCAKNATVSPCCGRKCRSVDTITACTSSNKRTDFNTSLS
ncbi:hypothetical protein GWI33_010305 [Rhynchophorus ferrugineus]|uniref:Uncharacterized protein n=1 Tax=Rhynchophorus ferrugineus TaxID=354439 RepID=A0A834IXG6_RHYFE|nr:hypothetical protein GWI33_010305 [Rhynchophorus ferrugineus]